jgi:hypothetical protein
MISLFGVTPCSVPPIRMSLPGPPTNTSLPSRPIRTSLPLPPTIISVLLRL